MRRKRLDRDEPIEPQIARAVHHAHAAATDLTLQLVLSGECAGEPLELVVLCGREGSRHRSLVAGRRATVLQGKSLSNSTRATPTGHTRRFIHYIWTGIRVAPMNGSAPSLAFRLRPPETPSETRDGHANPARRHRRA